jgi:aryl-alcohol dehydrogenase-like predicted oxidoreductase
MGRAGRRDSLRALEAAHEMGITLFDTARSYGYGEGEALLGEFLKGKRDRVVLSTKFGIVPAKQTRFKQFAKPFVRGLLSIVPSVRNLVQQHIKSEFEEGQFTVPVLRRSVEESLRSLNTDYIDILFMHGAPASVLGQGDLLREMEKLVQAGKVRVLGVSASQEVIAAVIEKEPREISAMQFPCNVFDLSITSQVVKAAGRNLAFIANHPFGGAGRVTETREHLRRLSVSNELPVELRDKLKIIDNRVLAEVILNVITQGTGIQAVIPAMIGLPHLRANVQAVLKPRFSVSEILLLRNKLLCRAQQQTDSLRRPLVSSLH